MVNRTTTVGFVANANDGRGTISLLSQCLSTIFLCVYTALHFDIPVRPLSKWAVSIRKLIFTLIMAIAPELLPYNAFNHWYRARKLHTLWNASIDSKLSMKQVHYLLSGGMQISASTEHHDRVLEVELLVFINQVGLAPSHSSEKHPDFQKFWDTVIAKLPSDRDLDDKSKSDVVGKAITCLQVAKSLVLIIGRLIYGLDVSLLEVTTAAYIALTLLAYLFWFKKPYNVATYQTVELPFCSDKLGLDRERYNVSVLSAEPTEHLKRRAAREANPSNLVSSNLYTGSLSEDDFYGIGDKRERRRDDLISLAALILFCSILGGIHIAAWNYQYPSQPEAWLWRASCLLLGSLPWYLIYAQHVEYCVKNARRTGAAQWHQKTNTICLYILYASYPIARIFLIVEVFVSLRAAPSGIYQQPDWTTYLGHIGA